MAASTPAPMATLKARLTELMGKPERSGMLAALVVHYERKLQPLIQLERDVAEASGVGNPPDMMGFWRRCVIYEYRRAGSNAMHYRLRSDFADQEDFYNFRMEIQDELDEEKRKYDDDDGEDDTYGSIFPRRHSPDDPYQ